VREVQAAGAQVLAEAAGRQVAVELAGPPVGVLPRVGADRVPLLWAGGGDHHTMIAVTSPQLLELTGGEPASVA
jgi:ubiquinone biosynthesis protein UbiJ